MKDNQKLWLWRSNYHDGKLGDWQPCYGFKPASRFGGNEYIEYVSIDKLNALESQLALTQELLVAQLDINQRLTNLFKGVLLK